MNPKELIEQSQYIYITLPSRKETSDVQAALTLFTALRKLGKNVELQDIKAQAPLAQDQSAQEQQTFVVSIKGLAPWISRVSYEKSDQDLHLYFNLHTKEIAGRKPSLPQKPTDLNIIVGDNENQNNARHPKDSSLKVEATKELATFALQLLSREQHPEAKLLGTVLTDMDYVKEVWLYIARLQRSDFKNSGTTEIRLQDIIQELKTCFGKENSYLILFESLTSHHTKGLLWSPRKNIQNTIMLYGSGEGRGNWVLFSLSQKGLVQIHKELVQQLTSQQT